MEIDVMEDARGDDALTALALTNAALHDCHVVQGFVLSRVLDVLAEQRQHDPCKTIDGVLRRGGYWLHSLGKLDYPSDFQAAIACARAMFEIAVDLTLLAGDRETYSTTKLMTWERSSKLKHVSRMLKEAKRLGFEVDRHMRSFNETQGDVICTARSAMWPDGKHPRHWSGHANLQLAARAADQLSGGHDLETYYVRRFGPLSWATHGSGLQAVRGIGRDAFPWLMGEAVGDAANFGMIAAERALACVNAMTDNMRVELADVERLRQKARAIGYARKLAERTAPNDIDAIQAACLEAFKEAAGEAAVVELKMRILCEAVAGLERFAHDHVLHNVETAIIGHPGTQVTADEASDLERSRQARNKLLHGDFHVAREKLHASGAPTARGGIKYVSLAGLTVEQMHERIADPAAMRDVADATSTATAGILPWLIELHSAGYFGEAVRVFRRVSNLIDQLLFRAQTPAPPAGTPSSPPSQQ